MKRFFAIALFIASEVVPILASIAVGIFGTIWQTTDSVSWLIWMLISGFVALLTPVLTRTDRYRRFIKWTMSSGARARALQHVLETMMQDALVKIDRNKNSCRVSLYFFHESRFHMIARYSSNPELSKPGRKSYPIDQGVIGKVWIEEFALASMPKDPKKWIRNAVSVYGLDEADAQAVSMKARKLGGFTIRSSARSVGIVMLESYEFDDVSQESVERFRDHILTTPLAEIVDKSALLFPAVEDFESSKSKRRTTVEPAESDWVSVSSTSSNP